MSILAKDRLRGVTARIVRPETVRHTDGSRTRAGQSGGETVLQAAARVRLTSLTVERREHVFGGLAKATETIRVPIAWALTEGDQLTVTSGPDLGRAFRVEKVIAYRTRPRITHAECALVALPTGAA
jgi:hypothetical protein